MAKVIEFPKGEVKFENVKFGYKEDVPLIENMNIESNRGKPSPLSARPAPVKPLWSTY